MAMINQAVPDTGGESAAEEVPELADAAQALRAELQAREAERQRLEHDLGVALEDRKALNRELEEARHLLARLRPTLDEQRLALDAQRSALDQIHASTSWRVTRPIRGMGGLARRLLRGQKQRPSLPAKQD
jgi:O-antigen biosynthesis protein